MSDSVYPYSIEPKETPAIWGGDALVTRFGKTGDPKAKIGESWECWDENHILNGPLTGKSIADLRAQLGPKLLGDLDPKQLFPILTKIIDAQAALSVQVHPDDAYAQRVEHQHNGKTECWYILSANDGAELVLWLDARHHARRVRTARGRRHARRHSAARAGQSGRDVLLAGRHAARDRRRHHLVRDATSQ